MTKQDGGRAFPLFVPDGHYNGSVDFPGMTLRDWFAGQALASDPGNNPNLPDDPANTSRWPDAKDLAERRARWAYHQADAMIAARGQP
jgi:hypothetical protein